MTRRTITINCDMGESFGPWTMGNDIKVIPAIDMANIACGFHASDPMIMSYTVGLAMQHNVKIGAHPSYPDMQGFGRRHMTMNVEEITQMVIYQVGALNAMCESQNTQLEYVKPHGALYNDMMSDMNVFEAIADAVSCFNVPLMVLAQPDNQRVLDIADHYELPLLFEAYIDRAYSPNGQLVSRNEAASIITDEDDILNQAYLLAHFGILKAIDNSDLALEADTICVHGDTQHAVDIIHKLRRVLNDTKR